MRALISYLYSIAGENVFKSKSQCKKIFDLRFRMALLLSEKTMKNIVKISIKLFSGLIFLTTSAWMYKGALAQGSNSLPFDSDYTNGSVMDNDSPNPTLPNTESHNETLSPRLNLPPSANNNDFNALDLESNYILGPGDRIETRIIGYESFDWSLTNRVVLSDGNVHFPFVGNISAVGKTLTELENELTSKLGQFLTFPVVDMSLAGLRPVVVNVTGEVYRPGPVQLGSLTQSETSITSGGSVSTSTTTPNLASALTAAGGIQRTADIRQIRVTRRASNGSHQEFIVNLWEAIQGNTDPGVLVMFDGDTVFVPEANASVGLDQTLISRSSIAPTNVRVRVIGEVINPGEVQVQPNSSVSSAIAAAGGPDTLTAQLSNVKLIRLSPTGQIDEQTIDLTRLIDDYQIQDGDVVLVPKKGHLAAVDSVSRILTPLLAPLNILNLFNLFD
jgi:polysaccharide export outer membrane protein